MAYDVSYDDGDFEQGVAREFLKLADGVEVAAGAAPVPGAAVAPASADEKEMEAVEEKSATARSSAPAVESGAEPFGVRPVERLRTKRVHAGSAGLARARSGCRRRMTPRKKPLWLRKELARQDAQLRGVVGATAAEMEAAVHAELDAEAAAQAEADAEMEAQAEMEREAERRSNRNRKPP